MEWEVWSLSTIGPNRYHPLVRPLQPGDKHILGWAGQGPAAHAVLSSAPRVLWPGSGCRRSLGTPLLTVAPPPSEAPAPAVTSEGKLHCLTGPQSPQPRGREFPAPSQGVTVGIGGVNPGEWPSHSGSVRVGSPWTVASSHSENTAPTPCGARLPPLLDLAAQTPHAGSPLSRQCCSPAAGLPSGPASGARDRTGTGESGLHLDWEPLESTTGFILSQTEGPARPGPKQVQALRSVHSLPSLAGANAGMPQSLAHQGFSSSSKVKVAGLPGLQ